MGLVTLLAGRREIIFAICLTFVLVLIIPVWLISRSAHVVDLRLELSMSHADIGQLFFDDKSAYTEGKSRKFSLHQGRHEYLVRLRGVDLKDLQTLRIDPGFASSGRLGFHNLTIQAGSSRNPIDLNKPSNRITPLHNLLRDPAEPLEFVISGSDPYLEIKIGLLDGEYQWPKSPFLAGSLVWLFVILCVFTYQRWRSSLQGNSQEVQLLVILFGCCLLLSVLIPPFQSPDEFSHVERAYSVAGGNFYLESGEGSTGVFLDPALQEYAGHFREIRFHNGQRLNSESYNLSTQIGWSDGEKFVLHTDTSAYMMPIYLPQALAFALGRDLHLSVNDSYRLARFTVLLISLSLIIAACIISRLSPVMLVVLGLPMMMFQLTSVTIDSFSVALALLAFSIYVSWKREYGKIGYCVLIVCITIVVTSRPYMIPMMLLPAWIAYRSRTPWMWGGVVLCSILCVGWILFGTSQSIGTRIDGGAPRTRILEFYLVQPSAGMLVFLKTIATSGEFYVDSFIGILGWLDTRFRSEFYSAVSVMLVFFTLLSVQWRSLRSAAGTRIILLIVALSSSFLIFLALLINGTEHPAQSISGVQGRYFTIPVLAVLLALTGVGDQEYLRFRRIKNSLVTLWIGISTMCTLQVLLNRYWF